jgi:hypothetical protein
MCHGFWLAGILLRIFAFMLIRNSELWFSFSSRLCLVLGSGKLDLQERGLAEFLSVPFLELEELKLVFF